MSLSGHGTIYLNYTIIHIYQNGKYLDIVSFVIVPNIKSVSTFSLHNSEQVRLIFSFDIVGPFVNNQKFDFVSGFFDEIDDLKFLNISLSSLKI